MTAESTPERRTVLRTAGGVVAALGLAGCPYFRDEVGSRPDGGELRSISYGETREGFVHQSDGRDPEYGHVAEPVQFEGRAGDAVTITMEAPDTNAYLVLTGPGGSTVAEHQRGRGGTSIVEVTLPATGTYTVWVGSTSGREVGPYTLTVERR